ncbi:uncharacterized protein LOC113337455 [Papaver somniferum]|uniref:uncharacterized protein LOC113337455 n=1 Tax=Papaver somniferum TaxID=3469 RepID=UPI000E6F5007|nr:uncharacterized protein LOC113337455 [Papaver somniferum]
MWYMFNVNALSVELSSTSRSFCMDSKVTNRKLCEYMFSRDIHCYLFPNNIFAIQQWCSNNVPHAKEQLAHVYRALLQPAILEFHQQSRLHGTSLWVSYRLPTSSFLMPKLSTKASLQRI